MSSISQGNTGSQIPEDLPFQQREWIFERVGWIVMGLAVAAALLGLLGRGPLSASIKESPDGNLRLDYDRFLHVSTRTALQINAMAPDSGKGEIRISLSKDYLDKVMILQVTPTPIREEAGIADHIFVFRVAEGNEGAWITLHLEPMHWGRLAGIMRLQNDMFVTFEQFVYP